MKIEGRINDLTSLCVNELMMKTNLLVKCWLYETLITGRNCYFKNLIHINIISDFLIKKKCDVTSRQFSKILELNKIELVLRNGNLFLYFEDEYLSDFYKWYDNNPTV